MGTEHATMREAANRGPSWFALSLTIPLDKSFLCELQTIAINNPMSLPTWATHFTFVPEEENVVYFDEKRWRGLNPSPARHRLDLYTIQRGLLKVFDARYGISIAMRQIVLRALFEQQGRPGVLALHPRTVSAIVQLAIFDQVVC